MNTPLRPAQLNLVSESRAQAAGHENQFDSFGAPPPVVMSQSYAFATSVAAMALSLTRAGITPKQILLATDAGVRLPTLAARRRACTRALGHTRARAHARACV
eukprot:6197805-Pleurochrysis_carterae.AAC.2